MIDRLERLLNLVIALREAPRPLTAEDVRTSIAGYGQEDRQSFRRMFERDKADLRGLGVPIEVTTLGGLDDTQAYRIDPARYDLPAVELAPDELAALAVAVHAAGLGDEARSALAKLEVDAGRPGATAGVPRPPLVIDWGPSPHLDVLASAAADRTRVTFTYRPAHRPEGTRTVEPHGLVHRRGRWYLVGHDRDRDARRAFRLDRITGTVTRTGAPGAFDPPDGVDIADVVPAGAEVVVDVLAGRGAAPHVARRARAPGRSDDGAVAFEVMMADAERATGWVAAWAGEVIAVEPAQAASVTAALERIIDAHTDEPGAAS